MVFQAQLSLSLSVSLSLSLSLSLSWAAAGVSAKVEQDKATAAVWFEKAAREGYAQAMKNLGNMFLVLHGHIFSVLALGILA